MSDTQTADSPDPPMSMDHAAALILRHQLDRGREKDRPPMDVLGLGPLDNMAARRNTLLTRLATAAAALPSA